MKKKVFVFSIICLLFTSCINIFNKTEEKIPNENGNGVETTEPGNAENNNNNNDNVVFKNNSKFDVNVYYNLNPYVGDVTCSIPANGTFSCNLRESVNQSVGDVFYFEYLITIGNAVFPYWSKEASSGYKTAAVKNSETTTIEIDELTKCVSKSAYLLIENNTTSEVRVNNANTPLTPYASNEALIGKNGGCGVYEVSPLKVGESSDINLGHLDMVKIKIDVTDEVFLPVSNSEVEAGNIYTISVNKNNGVSSASLKAITPFNIDTQKKIWSLDNSVFTTKWTLSSKELSIPVCMRPSFDGKSTLVMGTAAQEKQKIGIARIDEYGKYTTTEDSFVAFSNSEKLLCTQIIDFFEQQNETSSSIVMLLKEIFDNDGYVSEDYVFACYDFNNKSLKWYKKIQSGTNNSNSFYDYLFRTDSKNKLIQVAEDKFVCVGGCDEYAFDENDVLSYDRLHYMIIYIDGTNINENKVVNNEAVKVIISEDYSDLLNGVERMFTSAYFNGSDLFITGFDNWTSADYSTKHVGKIWKASLSDIENGSFDFEQNVVYFCNNCLFFSIDGIESNYVVCGEYKDTGSILKGCYVTSKMIKEKATCEPVLYTVSGKASCWFNQLCQYGNKIVLCGKAADSMDGSESPLPFVVAYDANGNKLWDNLSFTSYTSALNIIPNTIGTYMLQLTGKNGIIHYVNADLLGNEVK